MAEYTVPVGHVGVHEKKLVAGQVDTVTFEGVGLREVEILTDGAADIYVAFGSGSQPEVRGSHCWRVPGFAGGSTLIIRQSETLRTVVKLVSEGTPTYSVARS